jgi:7,8-dihydropterin-6-yl-methyl-4-(beta-D-ribofuranosyl)aminobenzene 5'-phosphate synthase
MIALSLLAENSVRPPGLIAEHGLAWWIDTGTHRVLFDTGQGMVLAHNARAMGIDLSTADAIVLSHGHFDHVGGLGEALAAAPDAALYFHPAATGPKFSGSGGRTRKISSDFVESRQFCGAGRRVVETREAHEVVPGIWTTGEIPRENDFEDVGGPFFTDPELAEPDPLPDDQAIFFRTARGLVAVMGCAHAGLVNTLRQIRRLAGESHFHAVLGGAHLLAATDRRMDLTVAALREIGPERMGFNHCTGDRAVQRLRNEFGDRWVQAGVGAKWEFPEAS